MSSVLTAEESAALRADMRGTQGQAEGVQLAQGDRNARKKLPALQKRLDLFLEKLRATLGRQLRTPVVVTALPLELVAPQILPDMVPRWAMLAQLAWPPMGLAGFVGFNHGLAFALIELAYGAPLAEVIRSGGVAQRPRLTEVERQTLSPLVIQIARELSQVMPMAETPQVDVLGYPFQVDAEQAGEALVVAGYEFSLGKERALIHAVFLGHVLEHLDDVATPDEESAISAMATHLGQTLVEVMALLGTCQVPVSTLFNLKADDVLWLDRAQTDPVEVLVEQQVKFLAQPIQRNGALGVQIAASVS